MISITAEMKIQKETKRSGEYGVLTNLKMDANSCEQLAAEMTAIIIDLEKCNKHAFMMALDSFLRNKGFNDDDE